MGLLDGKITIEGCEYRPCIIDGEYKGLFHKWVEYAGPPIVKLNGFVNCKKIEEVTNLFEEKRIVMGGTEVINLTPETFALVEYEDGAIRRVKPENIRFVDGENFKDYYFPESENITYEKVGMTCNSLNAMESLFNHRDETDVAMKFHQAQSLIWKLWDEVGELKGAK